MDILLEYLLTKGTDYLPLCDVCGFELDPDDEGTTCRDCQSESGSR